MSRIIAKNEEAVISKNGIPIYHYRNQYLHSFCICLYIKAGSLYETDDMNGSTHLWEHALFRKMNKLFKGDFYRMLDMLGLTFSASTYKEFVFIKVKGSTDCFSDAAQIISLVFEPMELSSKELNLEKKRIKAEMREDDEKSSLDYFTQQIVWQDTSLKNTIAGTCKTLDRIGVNALGAMQDDILTVGNVFFYVTGSFNDKNIDDLSNCIGKYPLSSTCPVKRNMAPVPVSFSRRNGHIAVKNSYYHYLRFSFDIDVSRYTYAELDLIYDILFSGDMSKIYQELSEKTGYIYDFDAKLERYCKSWQPLFFI